MHEFKVWAPAVLNIAVTVNGESQPMQGPDEQGWWRVDIDTAGPGTDYGFSIEGDGGPYPDPRSQWQPNGVHGLSRLYDQHAFEWSDAHFQAPPLASAVVYEIHRSEEHTSELQSPC